MTHPTALLEVAPLAGLIKSIITFPKTPVTVVSTLKQIVQLEFTGDIVTIIFDFTKLFPLYIEFWRYHSIKTPKQMFKMIKKYIEFYGSMPLGDFYYSSHDTIFSIRLRPWDGNSNWLSKQLKNRILYFRGYKCDVPGCVNFYTHKYYTNTGILNGTSIRPCNYGDVGNIVFLEHYYFALVPTTCSQIKRNTYNIPGICSEVRNCILQYIDSPIMDFNVSCCGYCLIQQIRQGKYILFASNGYGEYIKLNRKNRHDRKHAQNLFRELLNNFFYY